MKRVHLTKWRAWKPRRAVMLGLLLPAMINARSIRPRDPWVSLTGPLLNGSGAAALFEGGAVQAQSGLWAGRRNLFGLNELGSTGLAAAWAMPFGVWIAGLHELDAGFWKERQVALRWSPLRSCSTQGSWATGMERREVRSGSLHESSWWLLTDAAWRAGPLRVQARVQVPTGIGSSRDQGRDPLEQTLGLGWDLGAGWGLTWRVEHAGETLLEQGTLAWNKGRQGLACAWLPQRGWQVAGFAAWRGFNLRAAWCFHPVLPPTPAWGMEWQAGSEP